MFLYWFGVITASSGLLKSHNINLINEGGGGWTYFQSFKEEEQQAQRHKAALLRKRTADQEGQEQEYHSSEAVRERNRTGGQPQAGHPGTLRVLESSTLFT